MKQLGADHSNYKQFVPTYEFPILSRKVHIINEDAGRAGTDFNTPIQFTFQNPDPTQLIRSTVLRMRLKAVFWEQRGYSLPDYVVPQLGLRNRPSKCFRDVRVLYNGTQFTRNSELDFVEEHTRRYWSDGPYQLENTHLPLGRPRIYETPMGEQDYSAFIHGETELPTSSFPPVPTNSNSIQSTENRNFETRVKLFRSGYDTKTNTWEGDITVPLCCGPWQPYQSKKSGLQVNKYIPFCSQLQVGYEFETKDRGDVPTLHNVNPQHYSIAQMLFEKSSTVAEAMTQEFQESPRLTMIPYGLVLGEHSAWINIPLSSGPVGVDSTPIDLRSYNRNIEGVSATDKYAGRLGTITRAYRQGSGLILNAEDIITACGDVGTILAPALEEDSFITNMVTHNSFVGQCGGLLNANANGGAPGNGQLQYAMRRVPANPLLYDSTNNGVIDRYDLFLQASVGTAIDLMHDATRADLLDMGNGQHVNFGATPMSLLRSGQLRESLLHPSASIVLSGHKVTAGMAAALEGNLAARVRFPKVQYFIEKYLGVPTAWTIIKEGGTIADDYNQIVADCIAGASSAVVAAGGASPMGTNGLGAARRRAVNKWLCEQGFQYVFNDLGVPCRRGPISTDVAWEAFRHTDQIAAHQPVHIGVSYALEQMYHIGVAETGANQTLGLVTTGGTAVAATAHMTRRHLTEYESSTLIHGRYSFRVVPSNFANTTIGGDIANPFGNFPRVRVGVGKVDLSWVGQPQLEVEMVRFSPAVRLSAVQSLWNPENELILQSDKSITNGFQLNAANNYVETVRLDNIYCNEVFNTITLYAKQRDDQLRRFEFVETLRPVITRIEVQIAEYPQATSSFPVELLYRFFKENTLSTQTYETWLSNCMVILSPQQLGVPGMREGLSKVTSMSVVLHFGLSPIGKRLIENYEGMEYTGTATYSRVIKDPFYVVRASLDFENRSILVSSRREVIRKRNAIAYKGLTGLVKKDRGLPYQQGLKAL